MFSKYVFPGLRSYSTRNANATRYFVPGKGEIRFGRNDFKARGGEGSIYVKGSQAYKIFSDPSRTIHPAKIAELSVLSQSNIIRPLEVVLNARNQPVGYSMRYVSKSYALCQLFPKAFRQRNNLTPELTLSLVRRMQEGVAHIHSKGILVVDLHELNFLVRTDFREIFFIDVDSYQTLSFPATMLMESVRDRHTQRFSVESDWFSFAIVSFQMFVGVHPFKGSYPPMQHLPDKLDARMRANISVLHAGVRAPMAALSFSVIPPSYLDWYRAVFEEGKRLPPPDNVQAVLSLPEPSLPAIQGSAFLITKLREFDGPILFHDGVLTITAQSIYFDGQKYPKPAFDVKVVVTPRQRHAIAAFIDASGLRLRDLTTGEDIITDVKAEAVAIGGGQLFIKQAENIFAIDFVELPKKMLLGVKPIANVMMRSTRLFEGLAIQNLLGANYASILLSGESYQIHLQSLDAVQILDARLEGNVLIVVVANGGRYDKFIYRFSERFSNYDVRRIEDVETTSIDFTVLGSGIVLHLVDDGLEVFSSRSGTTNVRVIKDQALQDDIRLFHIGSQALVVRSNKLCRVKLQT
jgi:hypothetical protein